MRYKIKKLNPTVSLLDAILLDRGIEDPQRYLHLTEEEWRDPKDIPYMREAADCVLKHLETGDEATIIVDCDADGYTSGAVIYNYLHNIGYRNIDWWVHERKEHGIDLDVLTPYPSTKLLLVPDAGSSNYDEIKQMYDKGIDVVILD